MRRCLISFLLIISIILASCQPLTAPRSPGMSFREFTDTLFCDWASCDSLTLNYTLKEPSRYNITQLPQGFAAFSTNSSSHSETENCQELPMPNLQTFSIHLPAFRHNYQFSQLNFIWIHRKTSANISCFSSPFLLIFNCSCRWRKKNRQPDYCPQKLRLSMSSANAGVSSRKTAVK